MTDGFSGSSGSSSRKPVHVGRQTFQPVTPQEAAAVAVFSDWDDTGFGEDGFGPAEAAEIIYGNTYGSPATAVSGAGQEPPGLQTFEPVTRQDHAAVAVFAEPEDDGFGGPVTDMLPPVEVVQPRKVAPGNPVEIPVFPTNDRAAIPVPDPRDLKFGHYEMPGQAQDGYGGKDESRLRPEPDAVAMPDRNPGRVSDETFGMTIAPKGGRARPATHEEANRAAPWDSNWDRWRKAGQNLGRSLEKWSDAFDEDYTENVRRTGTGFLQLRTEGVQPSEAYARALQDYFDDRYGSADDLQKTLTNDPVGVANDVLGAVPLAFQVVPRLRRYKTLRRLSAALGLPLAGNTVNRAVDEYLEAAQQRAATRPTE